MLHTGLGGSFDTRPIPSQISERGDRVLKDLEIESSLAVLRFGHGGQSETDA